MRYAIVNPEITDEELNTLDHLGIYPFGCDESNTYYPVSKHPDTQLHVINNKIITHRDISLKLKNFIEENSKLELITSDYSIGRNYPENIALNAFSDDEFLIHNFKFTDENILKNASDLKKIDTKQGYTACTTTRAFNHFLTNDLNLHKNILSLNQKSLFLENGDIFLKGFDTGFIGGSLVPIKIDSDNLLLSFGKLSDYKYFYKIKDFFLENHIKVTYIELGNQKLHDYGGMIFI